MVLFGAVAIFVINKLFAHPGMIVGGGGLRLCARCVLRTFLYASLQIYMLYPLLLIAAHGGRPSMEAVREYLPHRLWVETLLAL